MNITIMNIKSVGLEEIDDGIWYVGMCISDRSNWDDFMSAICMRIEDEYGGLARR